MYTAHYTTVCVLIIFFRNRDNSVSFLSNAPLKAARVPIDHQKMALYRLEWEQFLCTPLPSDNDDDGALMGGGPQIILNMPKRRTSATESSSFASYECWKSKLSVAIHQSISLIAFSYSRWSVAAIHQSISLFAFSYSRWSVAAILQSISLITFSYSR